MNAKYHLSQKKADRCIAESAIQIINQLDVQTDLAVEALVDKDLAVADLVEEVQDHERCMMQHVEIVEMNAKYHFSQKKADRFIAESAIQTIEKINIFQFKIFRLN